MTPLPPPLRSGALVFWRLDQAKFASSWASGEGSYLAGGRWSSRGMRAVYAALDPATAILEVAVHKGFRTLDIVPHVLSSARIADAEDVYVVEPTVVPNPNWLRPGAVSAGQQAFGDALLKTHRFVLLPSVVSTHSWNVVFDPVPAGSRYGKIRQETFALDPRLHPPARIDP
ncbi:MAG TPA: RES domain-containing protein [Acetobacteraceae bacterium]|nr:RES domain-containing protein [Acetobacteraceae bacterium]